MKENDFRLCDGFNDNKVSTFFLWIDNKGCRHYETVIYMGVKDIIRYRSRNKVEAISIHNRCKLELRQIIESYGEYYQKKEELKFERDCKVSDLMNF